MARRILVTRPEAQSGPLLDALQAQGDVAIALPLLQIQVFSEQDQASQAIKTHIQKLADYQHLIFISTNAVDAAWYWIDQYWPQLPIKQYWYAIGKATAGRIQACGVDAQQSGSAMNSESLLQHPGLTNLKHQKVLIFRGQGGREYLRQQLEARGATVEYCEVYQRQPVIHAQRCLRKELDAGLDFLTVTSTETIQRLLDQAIIDDVYQNIKCIPMVVPGERVAGYAHAQGFTQVIVAKNAGLAAMLAALNNNKT